MAEKYIDMKDEIRKDSAINAHVGIVTALRWLDEHPDQVPGRRLTRSDMVKAFGEEYAGWATHRLAWIGYTVAPDPEPTNAKKLANLINEAHAQFEWTADLADFLDEQGVKAPGGDDD